MGTTEAQKNEENKKRLSRKIWLTRKARIEASERTNKQNSFFQFINVYYSVVMVAFSIWELLYVKNDNNVFAALLLISSIALTMFSVFGASKNYTERYISLKNNYIRLDALYQKIEYVTDDKLDSDFLLNVHNEYLNEIEKVENHESIDYYRAIRSASNEKLSPFETFKYYCLLFKDLAFKVFTLTFPIILVLLYCRYKEPLLTLFK